MRCINVMHVPRVRTALQVGTPAYVYDLATLRAQGTKALAFPHAFGLTVRYAMKSSPNAAILQVFNAQGIHIDASSGCVPHPHLSYTSLRPRLMHLSDLRGGICMAVWASERQLLPHRATMLQPSYRRLQHRSDDTNVCAWHRPLAAPAPWLVLREGAGRHGHPRRYEVHRAMQAGVPAENISLSTQELPPFLAELVNMGVKINACSLSQLERFGQVCTRDREPRES
jgi:hypothetical protein